MAKTGTKNNRGGWLKDARKARDGEVIGGGFFIFRRGDSTGRVRPSMWPYEHGTREGAEAEAKRLAALMPGYKFEVLSVAAAFVAVAETAEPHAFAA